MDKIPTQEEIMKNLPGYILPYRSWADGVSDCFVSLLTAFFKTKVPYRKPLKKSDYQRKLISGQGFLGWVTNTYFKIAKNYDFHPLAPLGIVGSDVGYVEPISMDFKVIMTRFLKNNGKGLSDLEWVLDLAGYSLNPHDNARRFLKSSKGVVMRSFVDVAIISGLMPSVLLCCYYYDLEISPDMAKTLNITVLLKEMTTL